ncbi:MAG: methyltransferase, RsmD family [Phycisphaerales bacterium]|nr:methyltransferase, RsmD family [Phycisphaerales bacterium]MDB5330216.1 methyltransferase, RsmD family [Phycisphaerales bacterium]MDB5353695.1 methyltransferase, RsmD family [Phycisphaerales bacterium]
MRIIAGEFRGRKLLPPEGDVTRPITDRVKQSLFDILTPLIPDGRIYDCFAGTGSMGLESLSRGATHATFFEADRGGLIRLRRNIETLGCADQARVIPGDLFRWFASPDNRPKPGEQANIIFLDPPYRFLKEQPEKLRQLAMNMAQFHLEPEGIVIFRHDARDALELPPLHTHDVREYGGMKLEFLRRDRAT